MAAAYTIYDVRLQATVIWPYAASVIMSLTPIETPGIGTIAVDQHWRLYYDPAVLEKWTHVRASVHLLREVSHLLQKAHARSKNCIGPQPDAGDIAKWNVSANIVSTYMIEESGLPLPPGAPKAEKFGLEPNQVIEMYYELLPDNPKSSGGDAGGSCSDGIPRPYELPPDHKEYPVVSTVDKELLRRVTAQKAKDYQKTRGNVPLGMQRWAEELLGPQVNWRDEFRRQLSSKLTSMRGYSDYSYRKMRRRQPAGNILLPGMVASFLNVSVVIDTSGSMSEHDLGHAMTELNAAMKAVANPNGVSVLVADADVHATKQVFDIKQVQLLGGGGTDMALGIEKAAIMKPKPDVIVVLTDAATPWPKEPPHCRVIVCVTPGNDVSGIPEWADVIKLEKP